MKSYREKLSAKQIKKRPRFSCRYCDRPAKFDVKDDVTGRILGLMCEGCCARYFESCTVKA